MKFPYHLIELTHTLDETSPSWEENCGFSSSLILDYADCTSEASFRVQHLTMPAGMGTHMDAPSHCCPDGLSIDQIPLDKLAAPCVVIDVSQKAHELYSVTPQDIADFEKSMALFNLIHLSSSKQVGHAFGTTPSNIVTTIIFPLSRQKQLPCWCHGALWV